MKTHFLFSVLLIATCFALTLGRASAEDPTQAVANLSATSGSKVTGTVTFTKAGDDVRVVADIQGSQIAYQRAVAEEAGGRALRLAEVVGVLSLASDLAMGEPLEHGLRTTLIASIIGLALWNLTLKILLSIWATNFDPTDYGVFQTVFGMIFTVIIALEFKRSLLVVAERRDSVVQVRSVILIALLAVTRALPNAAILSCPANDVPGLSVPPTVSDRLYTKYHDLGRIISP